jgi:hypothetical protein
VIVELRRKAPGAGSIAVEWSRCPTWPALGLDLCLNEMHGGQLVVRPKAEANPTDSDAPAGHAAIYGTIAAKQSKVAS